MPRTCMQLREEHEAMSKALKNLLGLVGLVADADDLPNDIRAFMRHAGSVTEARAVLACVEAEEA